MPCHEAERQGLPHAIHFMLAAVDPMGLPWVVKTGMGATFRDCTFPNHVALPPASEKMMRSEHPALH